MPSLHTSNVPASHVRFAQAGARRDRPPRVVRGAEKVLEGEPRSGPPGEELGVVPSWLGGQGGRVVLLRGGVVLVDKGLHGRREGV